MYIRLYLACVTMVLLLAGCSSAENTSTTGPNTGQQKDNPGPNRPDKGQKKSTNTEEDQKKGSNLYYKNNVSKIIDQLRRGEKVDLEKRSQPEKLTLLGAAIRYGGPADDIAYLIQKGAKVCAVGDPNSDSFLHWLCRTKMRRRSSHYS